MKVYPLYTDEQLLACIAGGDELAFSELYNRYWKKLLALALHKLEDANEAEDIVQQVFINLWKRRQTLRLRYSFATYVAAMLKYEILRKLARAARDLQFKENLKPFLSDEDHSTSQWLDYQQMLDELEQSVQLLPEKCQLVFRLSREGGLNEKEIAATLQIAPKTVQAHLGKALKNLRTSLQQFLMLF